MATNISNPSPSHDAEPEWQALLKTTNLPEGFGQHNAEGETFSSKQLTKSQKLILGLSLSCNPEADYWLFPPVRRVPCPLQVHSECLPCCLMTDNPSNF